MTTKPLGIDKLITLAKTQTALANQLGINQSSVQQWVRKGYVPQKRIREIVELYPQMSEEELLATQIIQRSRKRFTVR